MKNDHNLSEKWIKASIAGTIWAASEIVLGSFLHNLRVPFNGNILTAIGIIILISISYIWKERGLFWRAGLICAILKTMSPSAVIFGPMIAIFAESVLLELSVAIAGRTIAGYVLGAMLAMSWNLFHKIISYIVYYGSNIIDVYANLVAMAGRQLKIQSDIVWLPIIILLVVYSLFGIFSAIIGIRVGRRMLRQPGDGRSISEKKVETGFIRKPEREFDYSITWLIVNIFLIISSFLLLSYTGWYIWVPVVLSVALIWSFRYKTALKKLSRPKFWILFVLITLATAFVFTKASAGEIRWQEGILTGIQMNFRAIVIIMGFAVLGTELYNPVVRDFFAGTSFRNLPVAVELSVESLPGFIAAIPDFRSMVKNPVSIFYTVLSHAEDRLNEIKSKKRHIFIVTGNKGQGKTGCVTEICKYLLYNGVPVGGVISHRIMKGNDTTGYMITDACSGEKKEFLSVPAEEGQERIGKFGINPEGLAFGRSILHSMKERKGTLVIVDETGALELNDRGWSLNLDALSKNTGIHLLLSVRHEFVDKVIRKWNLSDATIFDIGEIGCNEAAGVILKALQKNNNI